jgi:leader peptidase (prepilin peptidase)/N-methyltransferase
LPFPRAGGGAFASTEARVIDDGIHAKPVIVALAGAAVAASLAVSPDLRGLAGALLALLMLAIAAFDARRFLIPDELTYSAVALGLVHAGVDQPHDLAPALALALLRGAVLGSLFLALRALYAWLRGREGLGLGDVKLAAAGGVWLDWWAMPIAIEIGALAALALYVVGHILGRRRIRATTRLPFGLFLAPAIWIAWLLQAWMGAT